MVSRIASIFGGSSFRDDSNVPIWKKNNIIDQKRHALIQTEYFKKIYDTLNFSEKNTYDFDNFTNMEIECPEYLSQIKLNWKPTR